MKHLCLKSICKSTLTVLSLCLWLQSCGSFPSLTGGKLSSGGDGKMDRTFISAAQTWDFDKDGSVTCEEWRSYTVSLVKESDSNGDGILDSSEFQNMAKVDKLFEMADFGYYDMNGDGRVGAEELAGKQNLAFTLLDKNGDCRIDRSESVQVLQLDAPSSKSTTPSAGQSVPGRR